MNDGQQTFIFRSLIYSDDGLGGVNESTLKDLSITGYLDYVNGTNLNSLQNAFVESSTHLLITDYRSDLDDKMVVIDENGRKYVIDYIDDPVGVHDHLEIYLTYGGMDNGGGEGKL